MLHEAGEDGHLLAARAVAVGRRRLDALVRGLPRVERAAEPHVRRLLPRARQVAVAVLEHRQRRLGLRVDEERQHEDLGVPEDVQEVRHAAQAAGADGDRVLGGVRRADHVVDGEAQRVLVVGVAVHAQVGGVPGGVPRRAVPPQKLVVAASAAPARGRGARPPARAPWCAPRRSRRAGPPWPGRPARGARRSRRAPAAGCARRASRAPDWSSPRARARRRCGRACSRSGPAGRRAPRTRSPWSARRRASRRWRSARRASRRSPPGVASARAAITWRSASEANRAVRTRTVRPLRSRCRQERKTTPWRMSSTRSCSRISPLESVSALPATMSRRPVQSGAGTGWRKAGSPVPSP